MKKTKKRRNNHNESFVSIRLLFVVLLFAVLSLEIMLTGIDFTGNVVASFVENASNFTGTFNNALLNSTGGFIHLNFTDTTNIIYALSGTYISNILNAGSFAQWNNVSWAQEICYQCELPNSQATETGDYIKFANMSANALLMHFNSDPSFGESSTNIFDFSGNGNSGTLFNGAHINFVNKKLGSGALKLDGVDDYVNLSKKDTVGNGSAATIEVWNDVTNAATRRVVYDEAWAGLQITRLTLEYLANDTLRCGGRSQSSEGFKSKFTNSAAPQGTWSHIVCVVDVANDNIIIYIDGVNVSLSGSPNFGLTTFAPTTPNSQTIGISADSANNFKGVIDELALYNRSLSAQEILEHYKRGILRLNLTARSCDDSACNGEDFTDINDVSPQNLSIANNTFFQYRAEIQTDNRSYSPQFYNITIAYTQDATPPIINGSLNRTINSILQNDTLNATFNATDQTGLAFGQVLENSTGAFRIYNFTLAGKSAQFSQNFTIGCSAGCVINVTGIVNDTLGNIKQNETIFTVVVDTIAPIISAAFNTTSPKINDIINFTGNITDETGLLSANITYNISGIITKINFTLSGTSSEISNSTQITCSRGCIINFTMFATDTNNNIKQNSTLIEVADTLGSIFIDINSTFIDVNETLNVSANCTDFDGDFSQGVISYNISGNPQLNFSFDLSNAGTKGNFSQTITINLSIGDVINITAFCNDTARTRYQNSTLITVAKTLAVTKFVPGNNSVNVLLKHDVRATFNRDIDAHTLNHSTIIVRDSQNHKVRGRITYFSDAKRVRLNPHRLLKENETYTVNLTKEIKGIDGTSLSSDFVWSFTTEIKDSDGDGILDINDNDDDNDNINDNVDFLKGNESHIKTDIVGLSIKVNESTNLSKGFNEQEVVEFLVNNSPLMEFNFTFGQSLLDLTNISIEQNENTTKGSVIINGLNISNITKTFYLDNLSSYDGVCIRDEDTDAISDISSDCKGDFEIFVRCPGTAGKYNCVMNGTRLKLTGLNHSAAQQADVAVVVQETTPSTDGGGASAGGGAGGGGTGGGGGGIPVAINTDFTVDKTTLKIVLKQGETKNATLSIKNTGTSIFDVEITLRDIEKFKVYPDTNKTTISLNPNEEKTIELVFKALENEKPDIYTGKIILKSPSMEMEVASVIEVESAQPLFDVDAVVLAGSKKIFAGQEILLEVNLFNIRGLGMVNVGVEYGIKDLQGTSIISDHGTMVVETQAKFTRRLKVPKNLSPGTYVAVVKVTYADSVGVSSDLFEVKTKAISLMPIQIKDYRTILTFGAVIMVVGIFIFSAYKFTYPKKKLPITKVEEARQLREEEKIQKLKKELEALESAYKSGFISEESYKKDKERIEKTKYNKNPK